MSKRTAPTPPIAEKRPHSLQSFSLREDPYYWLADRDDPQVISYLEAENEYADAALSPLEEQCEAIFDEIKARIVETDLSVPIRHGGFWYYQRTQEGFNYPRFYRVNARPTQAPPVGEIEGNEELLIDENELAIGHDYLEVTNAVVSPNHEILAYAVDHSGAERYTLMFRPLANSKTPAVPEKITDTYYGLAWGNDNKTVFYVKVDDSMRPYQVWRHLLYSDPSTDVLIFQESDERFNVSIGRTHDDRFIVIEASSHTTSECFVIDADAPATSPRSLLPRKAGIEYSVEHHFDAKTKKGFFLVLTNDCALDFRVIAFRDDAIEGEGAFDVVSHRVGVRIEGIDAFSGFLVISERLDAQPTLRIVELDATGIEGLRETAGFKRSWIVPSVGSPSSTFAGENLEWETTLVRIEQTSLIDPRTVSDLTVASRSLLVRKRQPVLGGFDPSHYVTYRRFAQASDGTQIPISIAHRRDLLRDQGDPTKGVAKPAPCLLYGYGSYEHSIDPQFSSLRLSLLDRGVIFAIAHIRGGGEGGRRWYLEGKLKNKTNTFTDFLAVSRTLVDEGLVDSRRLSARGGSAGGLLMGAIRNMAPERYCAIVAEVPFVDVVTTMQNPTLPLTIGEYEEWGNPGENKDDFETMLSYSPYDQLSASPKDVPLPSLFVTAGLNDPRVGYFEPAKWVAKLRATNPDEFVILRTQMGAGHAGPSGRYESWRDEARVYAFLLDAFAAAEKKN
jgi:oligopeptidase B